MNKTQPEEKAFAETVGDIDKFTQKVDKLFSKAIQADERWLWGTLIKFLK